MLQGIPKRTSVKDSQTFFEPTSSVLDLYVLNITKFLYVLQSCKSLITEKRLTKEIRKFLVAGKTY